MNAPALLACLATALLLAAPRAAHGDDAASLPAPAPAPRKPASAPALRKPSSPPGPAREKQKPALAKRETTPEKKKTSPIELVYAEDEGFVLRSRGQKIELKLGASAQLDGRFYEGSSVAPHSFDMRRGRLDLSAKLFDRLQVRIQGAFEDNPYLRNAFADVRLWDFLHLRGGQMKVPFSATWLAFDNQVDFLERGTAEPVYPFFDRGGMIWGTLLGQRVTYNLGVFAGTGVDLDANKGDIDNSKDIAWRLFLQPFRDTPLKWLEGLYLAGHGTWGWMSVPTRRFETRGLTAANFESLVWRWRTEQQLGTSGRNTDQIGAEIDSKTRWGAELHYLRGPFTFSGEWAMVRYKGIRIYHDFYQGSKRLKHDPVRNTDGSIVDVSGSIHHMSVFASCFLTGEKKLLDNFGWKQPIPKRPLGPGARGIGAFELLARFSATLTGSELFRTADKVSGYKGADFTSAGVTLDGPTPGAGATVTPAVLEGASKLYELTGGVNWTMSYHLRVQLDYVYIWAPGYAEGKNGIISAGNSELSDPTIKNKVVKSEHMLGFRLIMRI
jgi:phosphate-selective porin